MKKSPSGRTDGTPATDEATFAALGLSPELLEAIATMGFETPTPVQRQSLPPLLEGRDVLGLAATGTGKTAAFGLPLIQRLPTEARGVGEIACLVLVPTRELALQVSNALTDMGKHSKVRVLPVYGGTDIVPQLRALRRGVDVVVATPGRALDHLRRGSLKLEKVSSVVLDEADEMLDMGFAEDIDTLLETAPATRQVALFSATLPPRLNKIAERHLKDPVRIRVAREVAEAGEEPKVRQVAYVVPPKAKEMALARILHAEAVTAGLVFCRTRGVVDALTATLGTYGIPAEALHGGLSQAQRDRVMQRFRAGQVWVLVATDVAARGLDVEGLSHVVNYDLPQSQEAYVHRIGRTGRAGRGGVALSLVQPRERSRVRALERAANQEIEEGFVPSNDDVQRAYLQRVLEKVRAAAGSDSRAILTEAAEALVGELGEVGAVAATLSLLLSDRLPPGLGSDSDMRQSKRSAKRLEERPARAVVERPSRAGAERPSRAASERPSRVPSERPSASRAPRTPADRGVRSERPARVERPARDRDDVPGVRTNEDEGPPRPRSRIGAPAWKETADRKFVKAAGKAGASKAAAGKYGAAKGASFDAASDGGHAPPRKLAGKGQAGKPGARGGPSVVLRVEAGKKAGVRPADLVGAITNEAGVEASSIGAIDVGQIASWVEVPGNAAGKVMAALRRTTLRGQKVTVRRDDQR